MMAGRASGVAKIGEIAVARNQFVNHQLTAGPGP
jgi:hypothetical protein